MILNRIFFMNIAEEIKKLQEQIATEETQIKDLKASINKSKNRIRKLQTIEKKATEVMADAVS